MSFTFGFQIPPAETSVATSEENDPTTTTTTVVEAPLADDDVTTTTPLSPVSTTGTGTGTGTDTIDDDSRIRTIHSPDFCGRQLQKRFRWLSSNEFRELWILRRQHDIFCKTLWEEEDNNDTTTTATTNNNNNNNAMESRGFLRQVVLEEQQSHDNIDEDEDEEEGELLEHGESESEQTPSFGKVIQSGVYEGGGDVWECSLDLVDYLMRHYHSILPLYANNNNNDNNNNNNNRSLSSSSSSSSSSPSFFVLELGCGHALPSCYLLQQSLLDQQQRHRQQQQEEEQQQEQGCQCYFALVDYNRTVLETVTLSNVILNTTGLVEHVDDITNRVVVGAGDWLDMSRQLLYQKDKNNTSVEDVVSDINNNSTTEQTNNNELSLPRDGLFDVILAAETLYTPQAAKETAELVMRHLTRGNGKDNANGNAYGGGGGVALIASKRYYFGVGGGVDDFRACLSPDYRVETVHVVDTGLGNIREILQVTVVDEDVS